MKDIKEFRDIHAGERCFIIGNGPSLNKHDLSKIKNEITFGCNRIYLKKDVYPKYYTIEDRLDIEQFHNEINAYNIPEYKFVPRQYMGYIKGDNVVYIRFGREKHKYDFVNKDKAYFVWGGTVTYLAIQLAYYMGCNPIYLIGMDHDWGGQLDYGEGKIVTSNTDDAYHFSKEYYNEGKAWALPDKPLMEHYYRIAKERLESEGYEIYNATIGGKLEIFDRVDYNEL